MPRYPDTLTPGPTPGGLKTPKSSRARREPSGVFQLFQPAQIQQFKEAFNMIDQDGDGVASEKDLRATFANLGLDATPTLLDSLLKARPGGAFRSPQIFAVDSSPEKGVNFPMFLTMMGERLFDFDGENELVEAFECFDENDSGTVRVEEMRKWLADFGERMSEGEIERLLKGPFTDRQGNFKYREWIKAVRVNDNDEEPE